MKIKIQLIPEQEFARISLVYIFMEITASGLKNSKELMEKLVHERELILEIDDDYSPADYLEQIEKCGLVAGKYKAE